MPGDWDALVGENNRLTKEVRQLRARIGALESSRWWRLHPRFLLQRTHRNGEEPGEELAGHGSLPLDFDDEDAALYNRVAPYTMTPPPRVYALARAVEYLVGSGIPGGIVECGVWRGGSMMAAALTLLRLGAMDRDLYLFDTFAGMTAAGDEDVNAAGGRAAELLLEAAADSDLKAAAGIADVREAIFSVGYPREKIHFVEGPVEKTLPAAAPAQIALLRLDTDWYSSTKVELEHLYPRLVQGGVLIVDDYGYWRGARQAIDEYVQEHGVQLLLNRIDNSARVAVKL